MRRPRLKSLGLLAIVLTLVGGSLCAQERLRANGAPRAIGRNGDLRRAAPVVQFRRVTARPHKAHFVEGLFPKLMFPGPDLRPRIQKNGIRVRSQGSRGTCSVFAVTFLLEYMYATQKNLKFKDLSEEYLNYAANVASGNQGDGDFFSNLDAGYRAFGAYPEALVPYLKKFDPGFKVKKAYLDVGKKWFRFKGHFIKKWNPKKGASAAQLRCALQHLDRGIPVAAGLLWPRSGHFKTQAILQQDVMRVPARAHVFDGHSVVLVGYRKCPQFPGGGFFVFRNSWGEGWGHDGYGYMPFAYVRAYANDLFVYR